MKLTRRNFLWLMPAATLAAAGGHAAAQMVSGGGMSGFDEAFGVRVGQRRYDFEAVLTASNRAGNIFYPGETPRLTFQLQNLLPQPIRGKGRVEVIHYGTRGIPGNIWTPQVHKIADVESIPVAVDLAGRQGFQDITLEPKIPDTNGGYALVVDLGAHGRRWLTSLVRTFRLDHLPRTQYPQQSLDNVTAPVLERLGIQAIRMDIGYLWSGARDYQRQLEQLESSLQRMHKHKVTVMLEIGAGSAPQPLGMPRPHLTEQAVMMGGKCDYDWLPEYDEDYQRFVYYLASRYGWPKGPVTAFSLWNEPWEGLSISGWQSDMLRYRHLYKLMGDAVFQARKQAGVQVLLGGACSSTNAWDKFFPEGKVDDGPELGNCVLWPEYFDYCSIHYQGLASPALYKPWMQRRHYQGRVKIWDTESWVANTDDRVAGVLASNRAAGYDRSMGIYSGDVIGGFAYGDHPASVEIRQSKGRKRVDQTLFAWSTAAALGAAQYFLGERKFQRILFPRGLPWIYVFSGLNGDREDSTVVVLGDLSVMQGDNPDQLLFRTVRSVHEAKAKQALQRKLLALPEQAAAMRANLAAELRKPWPMTGVSMNIQTDGERFALYDFYGNPVPAADGGITIPLDSRGFFLRGDGRPGSFAALLRAIRKGKITGFQPVELMAHDFTAPLETHPTVRVVVGNVLNRPVRGSLRAEMPSLQLEYPRRLHLRPHERKIVELRVTGGAANPANVYPLGLTFDAGADGLAVQYDRLSVNHIARRTIKIDGDLAEWQGMLPHTIATTQAASETLTEAAWLPMAPFSPGQRSGLATVYLAYDDAYFYFAAKVASVQPIQGTLRFAELEKHADEFFYPETCRKVLGNESSRMIERISPAPAADGSALQRPQGRGRINGQWIDDPRIEALAFDIDLDIPPHQPQQVAIYVPPGRFAPQGQFLELIDRNTRRLLNRQWLHHLYGGVYALYQLRGRVRIRVRGLGDWYDARVGGIFFDPAPGFEKNRFLRLDYDTHGNWRGRYGSNGYDVIGVKPAYPKGVTVRVPDDVKMQALHWPAGVRRFTYRKWPVLPCSGSQGQPYGNIQIAFNAFSPEQKTLWATHLPGRPPKFIWYKDTDYEFALNPVAAEYGGGTEIWRLLTPGMTPKTFFPRQPKGPFDGPVRDGKLVVTRRPGTHIFECALPWSEIPGVKALQEAGQPVKFTCRINLPGGGPIMELAMKRTVSRVNAPALHAEWVEHWANELEFGWE